MKDVEELLPSIAKGTICLSFLLLSFQGFALIVEFFTAG
jgi:hypothetical protein